MNSSFLCRRGDRIVRESSGESAMNIAQRIAQNRTDAMAFFGTEGVEPSLTYGDVTVLINALARTVRLADFSSLDRIAVMTPRGKDGLLAFLAISSYATCCPLDPRLTEDELALTLRDLKVVALVDTTDDDARVTLAPDRDGAALQPA